MKTQNSSLIRWSTLAAIVSLLVIARSSAAEKFTRPAMMEAMASNCIAPGLKELAASAANLSRASQVLQEHPSTNSLIKAQQAWVEFHLTYKRNQMLAHGPVKDPAFWTAMFFRQAFSTAVENVVRSPRPINADFVEILGSSAKGFYVLEYLLFDFPQGATTLIGQTNFTPRLSATFLLEGPTSERRRLYIRELARDLESRLRDAASQARTTGFAVKFSAGGQDKVNLLVNQVINGIEVGVVQLLNIYVGQIQAGTLRYDMIEGVSSGTSLSGMKAALAGAQRYYFGAEGMGIDDYVRHVNPQLAARLEIQFKSAAAALEKIKFPLEEAILNNRVPVENALEEIRKVELLLKVDVVSALGVTIMFNSNDGD